MTNMVRYVPVPETGMVYACAGAVLKFLTCGIPMPNPRFDGSDGDRSMSKNLKGGDDSGGGALGKSKSYIHQFSIN